MEQNREQLKKLLEFLDEIVKDKDNYWFLEELRNRYGSGNSIAKDISSIRKALNIRGKNSINYEYITDIALKNQLLVDNLRMENYALNYESKNETERLYYFCLNAFFQLENILNFYYYIKYPDLNNFLSYAEISTKSDKYPFVRTGSEQNISEVPVSVKIRCFCLDFFPYNEETNDFTFKNLSELREIRNEGLHRCNIIKNDPENKLHDFFKYQNFNTIRALLKKVSDKIEANICNRQEATITQILASAIIIVYENEEKDCINTNPNGYKVGDKVLVEIDSSGKRKIINRK